MEHDATTGEVTRGIVPGGTFLTDFLYPPPAERRIGAIIGWWEKRRLPYNLVVAATGVVTATVGTAFTLAIGSFQLVDLFRGAIWWTLMANLCYTAGPVAEIALDKLFRGRLLPAGPLLFRAGITVAVGVTLLPILLFTIGLLARLLGA